MNIGPTAGPTTGPDVEPTTEPATGPAAGPTTEPDAKQAIALIDEMSAQLSQWGFPPWLLLLGLLLGFFILLLLLFWRRPVYVTGFVPAVGELQLDRKKDELRPDGRFVFPKVYMGKRSLTLDQREYRIKLKRKRKLDQQDQQEKQEKLMGIAFENKDDLLMIYIGKKVKAIELYLLPDLTVRQNEWAAIDKDHNVITPAGVKEPDDNKENTTPGGLHIDKDGELDVDESATLK